MIITVTPNPSVDWTLTIHQLTRGTVHRVSSHHHEPSGKGVNVTRALVRNGMRSVAVLPVGGAEGAQLESLLVAEKVTYHPVRISDSVRINVSLTEPNGTATKLNALGPTLTADETQQLLVAAVEEADGAAWVLGSGSLPKGVGENFYARLFDAVRASGARCALDTSGPAMLEGLRVRPDVIKPNVVELAQAVERTLSTIGDAVAAAKALRQEGAGTVLVSMGSDGALLVDEAGVLHAEALVATPVSTVGAGDALLAGYLAGSLTGRGDRATVLREAVAWGSGALRLDGSRVPVVTDADRQAVILNEALDLRRRLREGSGS